MKMYLFLAAFLALGTSMPAAEGFTRFMSDPSLSPDGKTILFSYQGDIWRVEAAGGTAYRITAMDGIESLPRFSPDGKWIAFTGNQDGNANLYVVPSEGGAIRQLTWHSAFDNADSWSWDSKKIFFTSGRTNNFSAYSVELEGGTPERIFSDQYWDNAHFVAVNPVNGEFLFSESNESFRSNNRKRYKGENNPDIKSYNSSSGAFRQLTDYEGKDLWPTVDGQGNLFFASDEGTGEYNLFRMRDGKKEQLTSFGSSIGRPQVSANGELVVFTLEYEIYAYKTATGESGKVPVTIFANNPIDTELSFDTDGEITSFDVSPDDKKIAFVSRGILFVSDIKGKFVKEVKTDPDERVIEVKWLADNKNLVITRTNNGWPNVYRIGADGKSSEKEIYTGEKTARMLSLNGKRDKMIYYAGRDELRMTDLSSFDDRKLVEDEFWFRGTDPGFSPDDRYVYFTVYRHFEQDIMIYDLKSGEKINLTNTYLTESDPFWSPDGKYIYFIADRTQASYPRGGRNGSLYRLPLQKYSEPFRSDEIDRVLGNGTVPARDATAAINRDNLLRRWESPFTGGAGQSNPYVVNKDTVTYVIFSSRHEGKQGLYKMTLSPYESTKTDQIKGVTGGDIVAAGKNYYILSRGKIYELNIKSDKTDEITLKFDFTKNLASEFRQMFYEGWTILAENYYDESMHGTDWPAMRDKYSRYLDFVTSREELRIIMNDMLGELNSSHMGFRSTGEEESQPVSMQTASTGILFSKDDPYLVERVVSMSPADNIYAAIKKGDRLVSVNGRKVDASLNRESYFLFPKMPEEIVMEFDRQGKSRSTKVHPVSYRSISGLLYDEWIAGNQELVDQLSDGRIGYVYLKDMGEGSLNQFIIEMTAEEVEKDALVVDLRYNTGGNIHDDVLNFLSRKPYLTWKFREGMMSPQPHFAPSGKPIVLLINQQSLSDAEMTAAGFKELGLGTIVGTETYRWIIFTTSAGLVDGSSCRLPAWGCYTLDGTDLEFSGVKPDVYIRNSFKDIITGKDPQLEKAVELLKDGIK